MITSDGSVHDSIVHEVADELANEDSDLPDCDELCCTRS